MFILNGLATLSVPAVEQASHLSSPAAPLRTAPAGEATGSWFRDSFVGKAWYNPQTSTIQKLQGSNALLSFVIGIFTGTLTNPLTLLSIGLGGAAFLLGITNPGLILACAAVGALQALGSAKDTLHSVKENGLFSLSTLMSAGGTALSAFCVMPGIGNLGNALKIAKLKSFTVVKGTAVEAKDLGNAILNTEKKITENLATLKESLTKGKDALKTVESKIVDIAKTQGKTVTDFNDKLIKDLKEQIIKKIEAASEEAKKELQKTLKDLRKFASERRRILVANNYGDKLRIKFEGIDGKGGILKSLGDLKANPPGALETFNNHLNYTLETNYDRYARAFIRETYGAQGSRGYDQIKGIVGQGKAKYNNWKGGASKSQIVDALPAPSVETPIPKSPAITPVTRSPMTAPDQVINGVQCRFNSVTGKFEPITTSRTLTASEQAAVRLEQAATGKNIPPLTSEEIRRRAVEQITRRQGPRPLTGRARQEWDDAVLAEINASTLHNIPQVTPPVSQTSSPVILSQAQQARQRAIEEVTNRFGYRPTDPIQAQRWDDLVQASMNGNSPSQIIIRMRTRAIVDNRLGYSRPQTHAGSTSAERARALAWESAYEEEMRQVPRLPLFSPLEHYRGSQIIRNYPRAVAELPPLPYTSSTPPVPTPTSPASPVIPVTNTSFAKRVWQRLQEAIFGPAISTVRASW